jgi:hypothetical protein
MQRKKIIQEFSNEQHFSCAIKQVILPAKARMISLDAYSWIVWVENTSFSNVAA